MSKASYAGSLKAQGAMADSGVTKQHTRCSRNVLRWNFSTVESHAPLGVPRTTAVLMPDRGEIFGTFAETQFRLLRQLA